MNVLSKAGLADSNRSVNTYKYSDMGVKLLKIAELFESDVLSPADALKAMERVIEQHTKVVGRTENGSRNN